MPGQINRGTELGEILYNLASNTSLKNYVEIGTWNGQGSTKCFLDGLTARDDDWLFASYEADEKFYQQAIAYHSEILCEKAKIIHGTVIDIDDVMTRKELSDVNELTDEHSKWLEADLNNYNGCSNKLNEIEHMKHIDVLLLDGGEFSTLAEFKALQNRVTFLVLDDTKLMKNKKVIELVESMWNWILITKSDQRNGFAVYGCSTNKPIS